jgi:hypothetical protein
MLAVVVYYFGTTYYTKYTGASIFDENIVPARDSFRLSSNYNVALYDTTDNEPLISTS